MLIKRFINQCFHTNLLMVESYWQLAENGNILLHIFQTRCIIVIHVSHSQACCQHAMHANHLVIHSIHILYMLYTYLMHPHAYCSPTMKRTHEFFSYLSHIQAYLGFTNLTFLLMSCMLSLMRSGFVVITYHESGVISDSSSGSHLVSYFISVKEIFV